MLGADAGAADGSGWQNRRWQTTTADSYGRRQTAMDEGGLKEAVQWWRVVVAWMAANGSGGIKINVGRLLRILFFARDLPVASFFFARGFSQSSHQNKSLTNKIQADLPMGKNKDSY